MPSLTVRPSTAGDLPAILAIGNRVNWDSPPNTLEQAEHFYACRSGRGGIELWVADVDGSVAGSALFWELWEVEPAGAWLMFLEVDDPYRGQGIGSRLWERVEKRVPAVGIKRMLVPVREDRPDGLAFAQRRGFTRTGSVDRLSRLDVGTVHPADFSETEQRLAEQGIRIESLTELGPDDKLMRATHMLNERTHSDVPVPVTLKARPYEEWLERVRDAPGASFDTFWLALDGDTPIGLCRVSRENEDFARNSFTGVDPAYRGRGIALALKLRGIRWARAHDVRSIFTSNAAENHPMLAINRGLGYQQLPATIEFGREF